MNNIGDSFKLYRISDIGGQTVIIDMCKQVINEFISFLNIIIKFEIMREDEVIKLRGVRIE